MKNWGWVLQGVRMGRRDGWNACVTNVTRHLALSILIEEGYYASLVPEFILPSSSAVLYTLRKIALVKYPPHFPVPTIY